MTPRAEVATGAALGAAAVAAALAYRWRCYLGVLGLWPARVPLERSHAQECEQVQRRLRGRG